MVESTHESSESDIHTQLSALTRQGQEVLSRLCAIERRTEPVPGARLDHRRGDPADIRNGRWNRAALQRLRTAAKDSNLTASDLRKLIEDTLAAEAELAGSPQFSQGSPPGIK